MVELWWSENELLSCKMAIVRVLSTGYVQLERVPLALHYQWQQRLILAASALGLGLNFIGYW